MRFCFQGIPDLFRKGRGYVNIFLDEKTYLGEVDSQEFQAPLAGFLGSALSDQYLEQAAAQYREDFAACRLGKYDAVKTNGLYQAIVRLAGEEESMRRLNALFAQKFLRVKPMDLFLQGYMEDLCSALAYRDLQTDHTVLQLLLDQEVE